MKTYHFARVDGDAPVHLVGHEHEGARVQALAPLDGAEADLFLAIEADDLDHATSLITALPGGGVQTTDSMSPCDSLPCQEVIDFIKSMVTQLDGFEIYLYVIVEVDGRLDYIAILVETFGEDAVAAVTDGSGRVLLEIGANSRDELEPHLTAITSLPNVRTTRAHWAARKLRA